MKTRVLFAVALVCLLFPLIGCKKSETAESTETVATDTATATAAVDTAVPGKAVVEMAVALDENTPPTTTFANDAPKLMAFYRTTGTSAGQTIRGVWIAEDVGDAAPKETKIDEASVPCDRPGCTGAFSLTKPTNGWPVGKYRVEAYVNDALSGTTNFEIQ